LRYYLYVRSEVLREVRMGPVLAINRSYSHNTGNPEERQPTVLIHSLTSLFLLFIHENMIWSEFVILIFFIGGGLS
jgi:hypothetical protein